MGGFPVWTLWGMGLSGLLALLVILAAYFAQSPAFLHRFRLLETGFSRASRRLTGSGVALLLLMLGFFLAGVPVEDPSNAGGATVATQIVVVTATPDPVEITIFDTPETELEPLPTSTPGPEQPRTGAFALPDSGDEDEENEIEADVDSTEELAEPSEADGSSDLEPTSPAIPTATALAEAEEGELDENGDSDNADPEDGEDSATETPTTTPRASGTPSPTATATTRPTNTPTPTTTPTPTLTPTPLADDDRVTVNIPGSLIWIYRVPGNQRLEIVYNGDELLVENGRAILGGTEWREVRTLTGIRGWIDISAIQIEDETDTEE